MYYVVMRGASGLKLYLSREGFAVAKKEALAFHDKECADMAAMNKVCSDIDFIGHLEVSEENPNDEQDLDKFTMENLVNMFFDIGVRINLKAVPRA
jgi:hypothetical protein